MNESARSSRKRLAVFAPSMVGGGAERGALKLAEGLAERGYDVDLVLAAAKGSRLTEIPPSVRLVDLDARRVLTSLPGLARYLRREKPHAFASVLDHTNVVALWARKVARYPGRVVVIEQNTLSMAAAHATSRRTRMMPFFVKHFYPWADYVVGVSSGVADDLERMVKLDPHKVRVIFNPIVTDDLGEKARAPVDHPWFAGDSSVFVAAGRLRPQKDFPTLFRAFAKLRSRRSARLVVLGEGPERENLEALIENLDIGSDVQLLGAKSNPYAYMARSVAFVLSSRWEGLPTVLVEALRCGVPVIATDCPSGSREILADGRYGTLVPVGDVDALALAMEAAIDGRIERGPEESWRPYELRAVVDDFLKLLVGTDSNGSAPSPTMS
ncbi:MAG: glycosyltransferase [Actinobacteria bacterium]|nr:glycosyltransferase [Actinomycetota bacterium]